VSWCTTGIRHRGPPQIDRTTRIAHWLLLTLDNSPVQEPLARFRRHSPSPRCSRSAPPASFQEFKLGHLKSRSYSPRLSLISRPRFRSRRLRSRSAARTLRFVECDDRRSRSSRRSGSRALAAASLAHRYVFASVDAKSRRCGVEIGVQHKRNDAPRTAAVSKSLAAAAPVWRTVHHKLIFLKSIPLLLGQRPAEEFRIHNAYTR
jgi:hypothetical protein